MSKTKINKVCLIGTLVEVDVEERISKQNKPFISGKVAIKSVVDNKENIVEARVMAMKMTKDGGISKLFEKYKSLPGMLNQRVKVEGALKDEVMVSDGQVRHFNSIEAKFFNKANVNEQDGCTFEYSGFVVKPIAERKNKEDELIGYRIEIAQANYNDTNIANIRFDVNKNDINIAQAIESNYTTGTTVKIQGKISFDTRTETKEEEVSFGEANRKTVVYTDKVYRITGGSEPYDEDSPEAYTMDEIKQLVNAYKQADADRLEASKITVDETPAEPAKAMRGLISDSLI